MHCIMDCFAKVGSCTWPGNNAFTWFGEIVPSLAALHCLATGDDRTDNNIFTFITLQVFNFTLLVEFIINSIIVDYRFGLN